MNSLQNSTSRMSSISVSLSSKGKLQSQMKPQDLAIMTVSAATLSGCIALILMIANHQRIGRRTLGHLRNKETREPLIKDSPSKVKEAAHQIAVVAKAHTHLDLHTACSTVVKPTITQKINPNSLSLGENWSRTPHSIRSNRHLES
jgi:hypothetical protein